MLSKNYAFLRHAWNATFETTVERQSNIRLAQSKMRQKSNLIYTDWNVALHMQIILELDSAHVNYDAWTGP